MGRIRSIKPDFFKHEALYDAEIETGLPLRLAYAGLWTCADKAGRFEWRERYLKVEVLPYDDIDFSRVLHALATRGYLVKYSVGDKIYGCIPTWNKHQYINNRETISELPEPPSILTEETLDVAAYSQTTRAPRVPHACSTEIQVGKGKLCNARVEGEWEGEWEGKGNENLTTTTLSLPTIDVSEKTAERPDENEKVEPKKKKDSCPHQEIIALYHEILPMCSQVLIWTPARRSALNSRWAENKKHRNLDFWRKYFVFVSKSKFLTGAVEPLPGRRRFVADLQWLINSTNFAKVVEGRYNPEDETTEIEQKINIVEFSPVNADLINQNSLAVG